MRLDFEHAGPVFSLMWEATRSRTQSAETSRLTIISASTATPITVLPTISSSRVRGLHFARSRRACRLGGFGGGALCCACGAGVS